MIETRRWTLKTKAVLLISGVFLGILGTLLVLLSYQIRTEAAKAVAQEVDRTWRMYDREQAQREESLLTQALVIANVPLLGATLDTHDPETVRALLENYRAMLGGDLYIATDQTGRILARIGSRSASPAPASSPPSPFPLEGVPVALQGRRHAGFFSDGNDLYQVATVPVHIGGETEGTLTLGVEVDDRLAAALKAVSDSDVTFLVHRKVIASTLGSPERQSLERVLPPRFHAQPSAPTLLRNASTAEVLTEVVALKGADVERGCVIFQRSLNRALSSYRRLLAGLFAGGLLAFVLLIAVSIVLAQSVTAPVHSIARAAQALSSGDWNRRVQVDSRDELRDLADAFNQMADRLQGWDEELRHAVERQTGELNAALTQLDRAYQQMRAFNADAAHELLTPLTVMRGEVEVTLRCARPSEEYRGVLGTVHDEVIRLSRIVEQLLTLSRADAGEVALHFSQVPLQQVLEDVCGQFEALAQEKGIELRWLEGESITLEADEDRLRQLLLNLIGNAIKFTPPDGRVECSWDLREDHVCLYVEDTGPGIEREDLGRIFDRFYRVDKARSRSMGGSGLGLAICKWIVESHHGKITVDSQLGRGTIFTVELPRRQNSPLLPDKGPSKSRTPMTVEL